MPTNIIYVKNLSRVDFVTPILCLLMFIRSATSMLVYTISFRAQIFSAIMNKRFPGYGLTMLFNAVLIAIGCIFAIFYDKVRVFSVLKYNAKLFSRSVTYFDIVGVLVEWFMRLFCPVSSKC